MPEPGDAGMMRMRTGTPLCRPMPEHSTAARIVCSNLNTAFVTCDYFSGYRHWEEIGCGIFTTVRVSGKTPVAARIVARYFISCFYFMLRGLAPSSSFFRPPCKA
jgi:hypothetical protein